MTRLKLRAGDEIVCLVRMNDKGKTQAFEIENRTAPEGSLEEFKRKADAARIDTGATSNGLQDYEAFENVGEYNGVLKILPSGVGFIDSFEIRTKYVKYSGLIFC